MRTNKWRRPRVIRALLCGAVLLVLLPVSAFAEGTADTGLHVGTAEELTEAFAKINRNASGAFTISLTADIVLAESGAYNACYARSNNTITLLGNGHTITYGNAEVSCGAPLGCLGGTLNLGKADGPAEQNALTITVDNTHDHANALVHVLGGGTVNMYEGVVLTGNINTSSDGGGVEIQSGTFNMYGGTISDCVARYSLGGGVRAYGSGGKAIFNMYGGVIEEGASIQLQWRHLRPWRWCACDGRQR